MALAETSFPEWSLGDRLAKARRFAGLDQDQMAEKFGKSRATISTWERDESQPRNFQRVIEQWGEITGVDPAWLLGFRTGSFLTPLAVITNPDAIQPSLPFDRHLEPVH
jgi:transcriptional regulator with XRE-family HTH domain